MALPYGTHQQPPVRTLLLGDENLTFAPCFIDNFPEVPLEVACCLPENRIPDEYRRNLNALRSRDVPLHFGINPAMLRQHFGLNEVFQRLIFVLPGIAFQGCPQFINKQTDSLFKLRLHLYFFGFIKSSQQTIPDGSVVQILWPNQDPEAGGLPRNLPWQGVDIDKLAPFCKVLRCPEEDELLNLQFYKSWRPLIHNIPTLRFPDYLRNCKFYSWRFKKNYVPPPLPISRDPAQGEDGPWFDGSGAPADDPNMLRMPSHIFEFSQEELPHVNDLFHFELKTNTAELYVVSKLSVKYDPRISGWKGDGTSGRKLVKGARPPLNAPVPPPPPPHENPNMQERHAALAPPDTTFSAPVQMPGPYPTPAVTTVTPYAAPSYQMDYSAPQAQSTAVPPHCMPMPSDPNRGDKSAPMRSYAMPPYQTNAQTTPDSCAQYGAPQHPSVLPPYQVETRGDAYAVPTSGGVPAPVQHQQLASPDDYTGGRRRFDWSQMGAYLGPESGQPGQHQPVLEMHHRGSEFTPQWPPQSDAPQGFKLNYEYAQEAHPERVYDQSAGFCPQEDVRDLPISTRSRDESPYEYDGHGRVRRSRSRMNSGGGESRSRSRTPKDTDASRTDSDRRRRRSSERQRHDRRRMGRWTSPSPTSGGRNSFASESQRRDEPSAVGSRREDSSRYDSRGKRRAASTRRSGSGPRRHHGFSPSRGSRGGSHAASGWDSPKAEMRTNRPREGGGRSPWQYEHAEGPTREDRQATKWPSTEGPPASSRMVVYGDQSGTGRYEATPGDMRRWSSPRRDESRERR